jgi:transposase
VHHSAARQLAGYDWLQIGYLPAYAPKLKPVEAMWHRTKYTDLANFIFNGTEHLG